MIPDKIFTLKELLKNVYRRYDKVKKITISRSLYVFTTPEVSSEITIPEAIPPAVSIENDFPGTKPLDDFANDTSLIKVNPDVIQKGASTRNVKIILVRSEGVSPGLTNNLDRANNNRSEMRGLSEKITFIFLISFRDDFDANETPIAEVMSHEARNVPVINS